MAKHKCDEHSGCTIITSVIDPHDRFLSMSTEDNFRLLGMENLIDSTQNFELSHLNKLNAYVLTNMKHSAFAGGNYYDEHGSVYTIDQFVQQHSSFLTRLSGARRINGVYSFKE